MILIDVIYNGSTGTLVTEYDQLFDLVYTLESSSHVLYYKLNGYSKHDFIFGGTMKKCFNKFTSEMLAQG